jgi:hypothetical protein
MADQLGPLLGVGDRAPDFDLPAADREGRISFSAVLPVAAAPDRSVHRAYGLPAVERTPEMIAVFT